MRTEGQTAFQGPRGSSCRGGQGWGANGWRSVRKMNIRAAFRWARGGGSGVWDRENGAKKRRGSALGPKASSSGPAPDARSSALHAVGHYATPLPRQTPALSSGSGTRPAAGPARQTPPEQTRTELVPERPAANQKSAASGDREGQARQAEEPATRKLPGEAPPLECF